MNYEFKYSLSKRYLLDILYQEEYFIIRKYQILV